MNKIFNYNGNNITFKIGNGYVMVTAIEMAKVFGKTRKLFKNSTTIGLMEALFARIK